ncbi:hypothetical protein B5V88_07850 [Heyndrickxia sporothermodurans]|nr:hypothetical protein B5V89_15365 [Heyndrickxia sporothermodurans]PTY80034.1 hypothetical protein B5V88_07850 [Heyndrickxia sporothermodurans]PTY87793.1 hypothetical protein B5V91_00735 [Heyndrickxia sporothermodurans]PTY90880.1 hypothetical protein B5V90_05850 [Heyndrickxia sporothermodurans]
MSNVWEMEIGKCNLKGARILTHSKKIHTEKVGLWEEVLDELKLSLEPNAIKTWFSKATIDRLSENEMLVCAVNEFSADWIRKHFQADLEKAVCKVLDQKVRIHISVQSSK